MPFKPKNERHAISEVVFTLTFSRLFTSEQVEALAAQHDRWKEELPRKLRNPLFSIRIVEGVGREAVPGAVSGVMFESVKRDGTLDWRLRVEDTWIAVNCLSYTRWEEVWPRARRLLSQAAEILGISDNSLAKVSLQYVDVFEWEGDLSAYEHSLLLRRDSRFVPEGLLAYAGQLWHLHLGWYERPPLAVEGALLNRTHLDAARQTDGQHLVKIDNLLRMDMGTPLSGGFDPIFRAEPLFLDPLLDALHIRNKEMLRELITDELSERIGLNEARDRH